MPGCPAARLSRDGIFLRAPSLDFFLGEDAGADPDNCDRRVSLTVTSAEIRLAQDGSSDLSLQRPPFAKMTSKRPSSPFSTPEM
eukprot:CAMPEP_0175811266 /NCGR_PEP_ID=MMETSP0107_2-20121207/3758_1 /TAXON_ID=195067 ORGANISM="Goniomonas pacifica, Strain CCMP1869" /NCGR_SAMPLE_ID=MMETSP0107_2 /ASSEMBLY_ACC=CAM_ASM_000203 /LENGTH=83 /DNA_ID=CAMNT_0017123063 /DNA_START=83 /DNA_END=334 /DNA_ORIENTATION=+